MRLSLSTMMNSKISLVKCPDYEPHRIEQAVRQSVDMLGGIERFITPHSRVLVKPNLLMAAEPEAGITTHPEVLRAVIRLLKEVKAGIVVADSPSAFGNQIENVFNVYTVTGVARVCSEEGVELVEMNKRKIRRGVVMSTLIDECDHVVNLPKLKTHNLMLLTAAIKNLFGLVVGTNKVEMHRRNFEPPKFAKLLVDIYEEVKPSFTLVDAVVSLEGDGPATSAKKRNTGFILSGSDCVALDSVLARVMGLAPLDILTTKEAAERKLGHADERFLDILGERLDDVRGRPFLLPTASIKTRFIPRPVFNLIWKFIRYRPYWLDDKCISCGACVKACPKNAIVLKDNRCVINYSECIACFCCQEVCPQAAIKVKKSWLARRAGL